MSEGELKKQITEKFFFCFTEDYMPIRERLEPWEIEVNASINWDDLKEIIDKVKQEFPMLPLCEAFSIYQHLRNHTSAEKQALTIKHLENCNLQRFVIETVEWFVRNFGEPTP